MGRFTPRRSLLAFPLAGIACLLLTPGAGAQLPVPAPFVVISAGYRDLDGDLDIFPDSGESGRVAVRLRNGAWVLTGASFVLVSSDPDVDCITERRVGVGDLAAGQTLTVGSLDPAQPGFTFRASAALNTISGADPARIDLCLWLAANELQTLAGPVCFVLLADLDLPAGATQTFIPGPDGIAGTGDDGVLLETFDVDRDGDGRFTVNDTFLMTDAGTGLTGHGFYMRGTYGASGTSVVAGIPCGGFECGGEIPGVCILDPDFPMDWHVHCPPGATGCPNTESGPCIDATGSGDPCTYATPSDGQKALSPPNSLHMGLHFTGLDSTRDTTHLRSLQAFVSSPVNLSLGPRPGDLELSMFHIADLMDNNGVGPGTRNQCVDCGDVQIQHDRDPDPAADDWGAWEKLVPFQNVYDHMPNAWSVFSSYYCEFTPADAGTAPPAPRGYHETMCYPQGAWSHCGSVRGTTPATVYDCAGPGLVDPSGRGVWAESKFDLSRYLGQRIRVRWIGSTWVFDASTAHYASLIGAWGASVHEDGWWLDDIRLAGVVTAQESPDPDARPAPGTSCPALCPDIDGDGYGSPGSALCPAGSGADCNDSDPRTYPGAAEVNDGRDNQCPGDSGHGLIDEISGTAHFSNATEFCWAQQPGATEYQVARSGRSDLKLDCTLFVTTSLCLNDLVSPPDGTGFFYLVRSTAPFVGSWGQDSSGTERTSVCLR